MLAAVASVGYCASLPLQERLVSRTASDIRGQVLGPARPRHDVDAGGRRALAGAVATLLGGDARAASTGDRGDGAASLLVTVSLVPGLRRSREGVPIEVHALGAELDRSRPRGGSNGQH